MKIVKLLLGIVPLLFTGCSDKAYDGNIKPDIGCELHEFGRPVIWENQCINLDKGFQAWAGPCLYKDEQDKIPDYYSINIVKYHDGAWSIYFQRDFPIQNLPEGFLNKPINELINFNRKTGVVTFIIGDKREQYKLPVNVSDERNVR